MMPTKRERERESERSNVLNLVRSLVGWLDSLHGARKFAYIIAPVWFCHWHLPFFVQPIQPPAFSMPSLVAPRHLLSTPFKIQRSS